MKEGNTFYITNPDGTVDSYNGLIVSKFDYDAYGNIINQTGTIITRTILILFNRAFSVFMENKEDWFKL